MNILAITQARMGSSRFPRKVIQRIEDKSLLEIHLIRALKSRKISKLIVATTIERDSIEICDICDKLNVSYYRGSTENVLERFIYASAGENPDYIVRLTSDCPLIDPNEIDNVIHFAVENNFDYASNTLKPTFPDGLDVEVFKYSALVAAFENSKLLSEKEHVTPYIWKNSSFNHKNIFSAGCFSSNIDNSNYRITVDTYEDFLVIKQLVILIGYERPWYDYIELIKDNKIILYNKSDIRNLGYIKSLKFDD